MIPFMKKHDPDACRNFIENPHPRVMEDTAWLQGRMAKMEKCANALAIRATPPKIAFRRRKRERLLAETRAPPKSQWR